MPLDNFYKLIAAFNICGDLIVRIRYKYNFEKQWHYSNEVLTVENDLCIWLNDWNEGQDAEVLGFIPVDDVNTYTIKEVISNA